MKPKPEPTRQDLADILRTMRRMTRHCDKIDRFERGMCAGYRLSSRIVRDYTRRV